MSQHKRYPVFTFLREGIYPFPSESSRCVVYVNERRRTVHVRSRSKKYRLDSSRLISFDQSEFGTVIRCHSFKDDENTTIVALGNKAMKIARRKSKSSKRQVKAKIKPKKR